MSLIAPNISVAQDFDNDRTIVKVEKSPLPYNDRRRFGSRLKRLHAYLGKLKPSQYDHGSVVSKLDAKHPCGSVACAFGHAVVSGEFRGVNASATPRRGATPDDKGRFSEWSIEFKVANERELRAALKAAGLKVEHGNNTKQLSTAADLYFGPGAWSAIFDTEAYASNESTSKATVRSRIKAVAEKAYGTKFE